MESHFLELLPKCDILIAARDRQGASPRHPAAAYPDPSSRTCGEGRKRPARPPLLRLDARRLDDRAVALDAVLDQIGELLRRTADHRKAIGIEVLHDIRGMQRLVHLRVEPSDDSARQARRAEEAEPRRRLAERRN